VVLGHARKAIDDLGEQAERDLILKALECTLLESKTSRAGLADQLQSLLYMIKQIGLDRPQKETGGKEAQ
jgi:hypothetical protein